MSITVLWQSWRFHADIRNNNNNKVLTYQVNLPYLLVTTFNTTCSEFEPAVPPDTSI